MGLADKLVAKFWGVLQGFIKKYTDFIKIPNALALVGAAMNKILDGILAYLKDLIKKNLPGLLAAGTDLLLSKVFKDPYNPTDDEISEYVAKHRGLQRVLAYAGNDLSESISGDIVLACTDPEYNDEVFNRATAGLSVPDNDISGEDFIRAVGDISDFDDKVSGYSSSIASTQSLLADIKGVLPWVFMVYVIVLKAKEWLSQNKNPSKFRGKYLSRLIRIATALMKEAAADAKEHGRDMANSIKGLIASLKSIDIAISAVVLAYAIYEKNRIELQKTSMDAFGESVSSITCTIDTDLSRPSDVPSPERRELYLSDLSCPISYDDFITPKEPFEDKILSFSCPIDGEEIYSPDPQLSLPLAPLLQTRAIYTSLRTGSAFSPSPGVSLGSPVSPGDPLFLDGKDLVLSSISGRISSISVSSKEIVIDDAEEGPSPLENDIKTLGDLYRDLIDVEDSLDKWYIRTLLPSIIASSALLDPSIASTKGFSYTYLTGGAEGRSEAAKKDAEKAKKTYDKDSQEVTGDKKIRKKAENGEDMSSVKTDVDRVKGTYYKTIKDLGDRAISQAKVTIVDKKSLAMIDWYLVLYDEILKAREDEKDLEYKRNTPMTDQIAAGVVSPYLVSLESKVSEIVQERILIDSSKGAGSGAKLQPKYEDVMKSLNKGAKTPAIPSPYKSYWEWTSAEYKKSIESQKSPKKALETISGILEQLGKGNKTASNEQKNELRYRALRLFELMQSIGNQVSKGYTTKETVETVTKKEGSWFSSFFSELWKKRSEIPKDIERIETQLENDKGIYLPALALSKGSEDFLYYPLSDASDCPEPSIDPELSPFTSTDWDNKKYWIKYCALATLASVLSPPWGMGIPPPLSIPLPTVYIPIKAIRSAWGITLIGLTITGIWIFPFVLVVNQDILHHAPFADPATVVKKQADKLKVGLNKDLKVFRTETLMIAYKKKEDRVAELKALVEEYVAEKRELKASKPKRDRAAEAGLSEDTVAIEDTDPSTGRLSAAASRTGAKISGAVSKAEALAAYTQALADWTEEMVTKTEVILETKKDLFIEEKKAQAIARAMKGRKIEISIGVPDAVLSAVEKAEAAIDKAFSAIDGLISSIDVLLASLPVSAKPEESYFLFTLKNPKPLQNIGKGVPEVNDELLQKTQKAFELNRDDLMSSGFRAKLTTSYLNGKLVANAVKAVLPAIIPYDPYPPYEKLKVTNVAWTIGYLPKWGKTGNAQYGFPGFPKLPTG